MQTQYYVARKYRHLNYHYLTVQLLSETPELPIANIGGGTWGGRHCWGHLLPQSLMPGVSAPTKSYIGRCIIQVLVIVQLVKRSPTWPNQLLLAHTSQQVNSR